MADQLLTYDSNYTYMVGKYDSTSYDPLDQRRK